MEGPRKRTSVLLILLTLFIGIQSQPTVVKKFNWTMEEVSKTLCNVESTSNCFFTTPDMTCLNLNTEKVNSPQCPVLIIITPPTQQEIATALATAGEIFFVVKIIGPYFAAGRGVIVSRWVGLGLRVLENGVVKASTSRMDDAFVMVCYRGRDKGRDILGLTLRHTVGNTIFELEDEKTYFDNNIRNLRVGVIDNRVMCEFELINNVFIERPPPLELFETDLQKDTFDILAAHGVYQVENPDEKILPHGPSSRMFLASQTLRPNDCGRIYSCLGKGSDGCGHIRNDCPIALKVTPVCGGDVCPVPQDATDYTFEMESQTGNVVMMGFADKVTGRFRLSDMGYILSCEKPSDGSRAVVVPRMNTCYGLKDLTSNLTEGLKLCKAVNLTQDVPQPFGPGKVDSVRFGRVGVADIRDKFKTDKKWLLCGFAIEYQSGAIQVNVTLSDGRLLNQTLDFNSTKYYLAVGALNTSDFGSNVTGGYATQFMPLPKEMIFTRVAAFLYDITRVDIQMVVRVTTPDPRVIGSLNDHDPDSAPQMVSHSVFVLLISSLVTFILTRGF